MLLVGFRHLQNVYPTHTHTHKLSLAQTDRKTSQTEFHGEKWRIAVVAVASDDVTTALRRRRIAFQCCFAALLLHFVLPMAHPAAIRTPAPILHTLTNLQRLTYLTCWHALNRMSDVGRGTPDEGRHCSKARNTLRQFAAAKRADDGEWRRMTVERRTDKTPAATADATRVIRGIQFNISNLWNNIGYGSHFYRFLSKYTDFNLIYLLTDFSNQKQFPIKKKN